MIAGVRAFFRGLNDVRRQGYIYIWANLAFVALSLPIVTLPAAYAALVKVAYHAQTETRAPDTLDLFWETFKAHLLTGLIWGLSMAAALFVIITNMVAYAPYQGVGVQALRSAWLLGLLIWSGLLLFTWPMYYEMVAPTVWGATRNALVLMLRNPSFTLIIILFVVLLAAVSTLSVVAWLVLSCAAVAAVGTAAVVDRLSVYRAARRIDAIHS